MSDVQAPKVAVIVVHGVAFHAPGASAQAAAELLHGLRRGRDSSPYRADEEQTVSIPLKQLRVVNPIPEVQDKSWVSKLPVLGYFSRCLQERTIFLTRAWRDAKATKQESEVGREKVANDFMRLVLQDYQGVQNPNPNPDEHDEAASYVTTCLKLTRDATPPSLPSQVSPALPARTDVHIYECYWADLSRPDNTVLSFFLGLYQMLFHFASLSRLAISTGVLENPKPIGLWSTLDWVQLWAVRVLTLPIPILNLLLFVSLIGVLPALVSDTVAAIAAAASAALLGLLGYLIVSSKLPSPRWPLSWALMPILPALLLGAFAWCIATHSDPRDVLAVEGWIFGAALIEISVSSYNEVRDGARQVAWTLYLLALGTFIAILCTSDFPDHSIARETLRMMQFVLAALRFSWITVILLALFGFIVGCFAWRSQRDAGQRARAKAAVRASRFALAMPALSIMIVTLAIWSAVFVRANKSGDRAEAADRYSACPPETLTTHSGLREAGRELATGWHQMLSWRCSSGTPSNTPADPTQPQLGVKTSLAVDLFGNAIVDDSPCSLHGFAPTVTEARGYACLKDDGRPVPPGDYFRGLFVWSATPGAPLIVLTMLAGNFLLILWLIPSILTESDPPRGSNNTSSKRLGAWLSRGLDATAIAFFLFGCAAFALPFGFMILHFMPEPPFLKFLNTPTALMLEWLGAVTGSVAILASVAKSGSSILGIMLDVDNYLRTSPPNKTPRARIVERYVSLLRYIADDTNPERRYDRVVILAHSLGSTISGDLLLFLKEQGDPGLKRLGLGTLNDRGEKNVGFRLFTMGNPGRQFLNRFFPYLYEWVREKPDNTEKHLGGLVPSGPSTLLSGPPDPNRLGVDCWVNAYRSGDYIGRSLWMDEWYGRSTPADAGGKIDGAYPAPVFVATDSTKPARRAEMCIGAGAHQHYWDQSAPDIAEKLDELIVL